MQPANKKICLEKEIPNQKSWFDLPYDVRYMIIGMMDIDTKLAYLLCSNDCAAEMSKNVFKKIVIHENNNGSISVRMFSNYNSYRYEELIFKNTFNSHCVVFLSNYHGWREEYRKTLNVVFAIYFRRLIWNTPDLESFEFQSAIHSNINSVFKTTSIKQSKHLKTFDIKMFVKVDLFDCGFIDFEQLCNITDHIYIDCMHLEVAQIKRLKSVRIAHRSKEITSQYVNDYLKCFINGEIHESVRKLTLFNLLQKLESQQIMNGFGVREKFHKTSFALVCTVNNIRIAVVERTNNRISIEQLSKAEFENGQDYQYYGKEIEEYLQHHS